MLRVLQGDVGSGKTIVSLIAAYAAINSGCQVAFLCPTELLAKQHFFLSKKIFNNLDCKIELLSGKIKISEQKNVRSLISSGNIDLIIGTHSLFQEKTLFHKKKTNYFIINFSLFNLPINFAYYAYLITDIKLTNNMAQFTDDG